MGQPAERKSGRRRSGEARTAAPSGHTGSRADPESLPGDCRPDATPTHLPAIGFATLVLTFVRKKVNDK